MKVKDIAKQGQLISGGRELACFFLLDQLFECSPEIAAIA
jgi:hypothetical protein